jgi:hypothetical protein
VKANADGAALFREKVLYWLDMFGATDWTVQFATEDAEGREYEAEADYDCETRHCKMTYYLGVKDTLHPEDVALHEVLHLIRADLLLVAIEVGRVTRTNEEAENHVLLQREEHKLIEREIKVFNKLRKK